MFGHLEIPVPHPSYRLDLQVQLDNFKLDEENNYTLAFTNHLEFNFPTVLLNFSQYSDVNPPIVSRGPSEGQVLISFKSKVEGNAALTANFDTNKSMAANNSSLQNVVMHHLLS
jgi:hypothetical protein